MAELRPQPELERVWIRVERVQKFVARELMSGHKALGGQTLEQANIDPDTPLAEAAALMIQAWAQSSNGITGYIAQWGLLEKEIRVVHHIKIFVDGKLAYEEELT